jgi:hypothetical protein
MAHVAVPKDEGGVGLDHLEGVFALSWLGHYEAVRVSDWALAVVEMSMGDKDVLVVIWGRKSESLPRSLSRLSRLIA